MMDGQMSGIYPGISPLCLLSYAIIKTKENSIFFHTTTIIITHQLYIDPLSLTVLLLSKIHIHNTTITKFI